MKKPLLAMVSLVLASIATSFAYSAPESETKNRVDAFVIEAQQPSYPQTMLYRGTQGEAMLRLKVDAKGKVVGLAVQSASNLEFAKAAVSAVKSWRFQPSTLDGIPTEQIVVVPIKFRIESNHKNIASL